MAEVTQSVSPAEGKERQVHAGFAKLRGRGWEFFMQKYEIVLGRHSKNSAVDIDLAKDGGAMNVSRRHARVYYNFDTRRFELEVLGKNGATVDGQLKVPSDGPVPLESQMLVVIGDFPFYFLLPTKKIEKRRPIEQNGFHTRAAHNGIDFADGGANGACEMETESGGVEAGDEAKLPEDGMENDTGRESYPEESGYEMVGELEPSDLEEGHVLARGEKGGAKKGGFKMGSVKKGSVKKGGGRGVAKEELVEDEGEQVDGDWRLGGRELGYDSLEEPKMNEEHLRMEQEEGLDDVIEEKPLRRAKRETGSTEGIPPVVGGRRKRESEGEVEEPGPSTGQKKAARKSNRDGSPEPTFHGRNLRVASPPRRKWPGEGDAKPTKVAPASPTRAGTKRAAAERTRGGVILGDGEGGEENGHVAESELVDAVVGILGGQDDRTAAVPLNKLFMLLSERHRDLYERSRDLLTAAAEGDASEQLHRPWLALASFLKRYPQHFVVESQAKGRLVSWYAALRQA